MKDLKNIFDTMDVLNEEEDISIESVEGNILTEHVY